jgi:pimeloyl-ACP methyl ester carboxylesterase
MCDKTQAHLRVKTTLVSFQLACRHIAQHAVRMQPKVALVLHGLLGQGRNWRTFSRNLAQRAEKTTGQPWQVLTLDLRCHGDSAAVAGFHPPHDMQSSARDVLDFVKAKLGCVVQPHEADV